MFIEYGNSREFSFMTSIAASDKRQKILNEVLSWPGVETKPHRFGGTEFLLGKRELGHLHGDSLLDIPFPRKVKDVLVARGEAEEHHVLPGSGWISYRIHSIDEADHAVELLHRSYELAVESRMKRTENSRVTLSKE
jgi:hypothetical protein